MIKNFKSYERLNREGRKPKRKRGKFKLAVLITTAVLTISTLASCMVPIKRHETNYNSKPAYTETIVEEKSDYEQALDDLLNNYDESKVDEYYQSIINSKLQLTAEQRNALVSSIESVEPEYAYSDIYDVESAYNRYQQVNIYDSEVDNVLANRHLDLDKIVNIVKANNAKYKADNFVFYQEFSDQEIRDILTVIVDTINYELDNNTFSATLDDLSQNIASLKIFKSPTLDNAAVTDDNCLLVSLSSMESMKNIADNENADKIVLAHEAEHLIQKISGRARNEMGVERAYGYNLSFKDLPVNSLYQNWLIEGSAENLACKIYDSAPTTYKTKIGYIDTLTFSLLLNEDFKPYDIERLTQQQSLDKVFETFHCETEEQKMEFLNMMEAINIIQEEPEDFMSIYENKILGHEASDDDLATMKVELKNGVCTTITKYFYRSLTEKLARENISVSDIFSLISIFEADMNVHITYAKDGAYEARKDFFDNYSNIQNNFFSELAKSLGVSFDDVLGAYQQYNGAIEVKLDLSFEPAVYDKMDIECLSNEKDNFVNKIFRNTINNKTASIQEVGKINQNVNQK